VDTTSMTSRTEYCTQTPNKPSLFDVQYLRNHQTLDIGVLGYIGIVWPKEHSPKVRPFPPGTPCILYNIYYSSDSPSSLITESLSVTQSLLHTQCVSQITVKALVTSNIIQSVCLVGKGQLKERWGLEPRTNIFFV